jgi:hypothetical protein
MTLLSTFTRLFYDERAQKMAEFFDRQSEELTQAGWRNVAIGVTLTFCFIWVMPCWGASSPTSTKYYQQELER